MTKQLSAEDLADLRAIAEFRFMGGRAPSDYATYRRFRSLQRRRLIKFFDRAHVRWDRTFFEPTEKGAALLEGQQ